MNSLKLLFYEGVDFRKFFILDTLILMGSLAHKKQKFIANCKNYLYVNTFDLLKITVVIIISEFSVFFSIFLI